MTFKNDDRGFVALLTTIMISLLLLVMTISLVSVEAIQLRKSEDAEQSLRAYYTAEAGVEDAVSKVLDQSITPGSPNVCSADTTYDIPGASGWTCQQVTFTGAPKGLLSGPPDSLATTVNPGKTATPYSQVLVEWGQSASTVASQFDVAAGGLPTEAAYTDPATGYAVAPIELSIVQYPDGGFASSAVCTSVGVPAGCSVALENALIMPKGNSASTIPYSTTAAFTTHGEFNGNCIKSRTLGYNNQPTDYNCYALLTGFNAANDYLFRIRSLYMASSFKMTFLTAANAVVPVPTGTALIDVTARAGQSYRRVISELPLGAGAAGGLNFVMYSDGNICKNFDVINGTPSPGCPY